jgi:hypothetical protein
MSFNAAAAFLVPLAEPVIKQLATRLKERYSERGITLDAFGDLVPSVDELADGITELIKTGDFAPVGKKVTDALVDKLEDSIEQFQKNAPGILAVDRILGRKAIKRLLTREGCGVTSRRPTDPGPASPRPDPLSPVPHVILYKIISLPRIGLHGTFDESFGLLNAAFAAWQVHLNLKVDVTDKQENANLVISTDQLKGAPVNYLALTDIGPPNGRQLRMVFDVAESWDADTFRSCAAHEFGHALGVWHKDVPQQGQLMNDTLDAKVKFPGVFDLQAAKRIWGGKRTGSTPGTVVPPIE